MRLIKRFKKTFLSQDLAILKFLLLLAVFLPLQTTEIYAQSSTDFSSEATQSRGQSVSGSAYLPYANFVNYKYQGDQHYFTVQDIIMEYTPDTNGVFQVTAFSDMDTIAYVYQIRDGALYELASFSDYYTVEDLRYSADATDGIESLVLPSNLSVGTRFSSGYGQEKSLEVAFIHPTYNVGGQNFDEVVQLAEYSYDQEGEARYDYYYAPTYGLILVERTGADGVTEKVLQLISTQGYQGQ